MRATRTASIPIAHLIAEMAASPLASEASFRSAIVTLSPTCAGSSAGFWRATERALLAEFPSFSIDEMVHVRDWLWFRTCTPDGRSIPVHEQAVPLHRYLGSLSHRFLSLHGALARPTVPAHDVSFLNPRWSGPPEARARWLWRWISFALPDDLLLAPLGLRRNQPTRVELLSPLLAKELAELGFVEPHLHVGAALDFPMLWISALRAVAQPRTPRDALYSPGAELDEGRELVDWVLRAGLARYILTHFLTSSAAGGDFRNYLDTGVYPQLLDRQGVTALGVVHAALKELMAGELAGSSGFDRLRRVYGILTQVLRPVCPISAFELHGADAIASRLPPTVAGATPELRFIAKALQYLESHPDDRLFGCLFWQVIRVRNLLFRHVVQRPMIPGLQWFVRFYGRISPLRRPIGTEILVEKAAELCGHGYGLRSLEVRTSPKKAQSKMLDYIVRADAAARTVLTQPQGTEPEFGLVFHLAKDRGGGARQGKPNAYGLRGHADPFNPTCGGSDNLTGFRFGSFYQDRRAQARSLVWVLRHFPLALRVVRGVDVCTDELGVPNWVLAPLVRYVREASGAASQLLSNLCGLEVPPIHTTAHVGEDFVHLLAGLRRIDEVVDHFSLKAGDRLGHAVALGVDAREWAQTAGRVPVPRGQRLMDLSWEWSWYGRAGAMLPPGRQVFLERELERLSADLWGAGKTAFEIERLVVSCYDEEALRAVGYPNRYPAGGMGPDQALLHRFLTSPELYRRAQEIEWVDSTRAGDILAALQSALRRKIGERGITIEINPSSNLLIGNLSELTKHPLWRLRPPSPDPDCPPLAICIGSDDPLTFATHTRAEYQLLKDALGVGGLSDSQAQDWLNGVRRAGLEARFTLPRNVGTNLGGLESPSGFGNPHEAAGIPTSECELSARSRLRAYSPDQPPFAVAPNAAAKCIRTFRVRGPWIQPPP